LEVNYAFQLHVIEMKSAIFVMMKLLTKELKSCSCTRVFEMFCLTSENVFLKVNEDV